MTERQTSTLHKQGRVLCLLIIFMLALVPDIGAAKKKLKAEYKAMKVVNGGSISGKALFAGPVIPKDEMVKLTSERELCGDTLPAGKYIINESREIKNVIVFIANIRSGKEIPRDPVTIDNVKCAFVPHANISFLGNTVINRNSDPVLHGVHPYIGRRTAYNIGLPDMDRVVNRKLVRTGLMDYRCSPHPWMRAYIYVFTHPYAAITGESGDFSITEIPAGSYEIKAWHEAFGEISLGRVAVTAGESKKITVKFK